MGSITGNGTAVKGLGGVAGFGETLLPRGDDAVTKVDVSAVFGAGFTLGGTNYAGSQLFISTDGLVSFGTGFSGVASNPAAIPAPFFAIFNADVDTRLDGEAPESGGVWLDVDTANDCVTITWDRVGFYRRNASQTDTFQMQLFDRGGGNFDVVYRYQNIDWTAGDLQGGWGGLGGTAATIGYRLTASGAVTELAASGNETAELNLPQTNGNTGVKGLWVFSVAAPSVINGTSSADTLHGTSGNDTMHGFGGSDLLMGSAGADLIDGGSGRDMVDYSASSVRITLDLMNGSLNTGMAAGDSFVSIEAFRFGNLADTARGSAAADWFEGGNGADNLQGRYGNDTLFGNAGADRLKGGGGFDSLDGGDGNDTILGSHGNDQLLGGLGDDQLFGGNGSDTLQGSDGRDRLSGNFGDDKLYGDSEADVLFGGAGRDTLDTGAGDDRAYGGTGADALFGGAGRDTLSGGKDNDNLVGGYDNDRLLGDAGADRLDGGPGGDTLTGGAGADRFLGSGRAGTGKDWITDFSHADGDVLVFDAAGATRADFGVTLTRLPGVGNAKVAEVLVTYLPTGILVWTIVDGGNDAAIMLHSSMNSFDIL